MNLNAYKSVTWGKGPQAAVNQIFGEGHEVEVTRGLVTCCKALMVSNLQWEVKHMEILARRLGRMPAAFLWRFQALYLHRSMALLSTYGYPSEISLLFPHWVQSKIIDGCAESQVSRSRCCY
jgi:hypothetical protein